MRIEDVPKELVDIGIIDPNYHARLLMNLSVYAAAAGIPEGMVLARLSQYCTQADMEWFKGMKHGKECGVVYVGLENSKVPIEDRMLAMTGAFLRNYVNAKFMVVQDVLLQLKKGEMPECTVLLIPNFCLSKGDGGHIASWEVSSLLGLLYSRLGKGLKTVLYVSSMESLVAQYGKPFKSHIDSHYVIVQ